MNKLQMVIKLFIAMTIKLLMLSLITFPVSLGLLKISDVRGPSAVQNGSTSRLVLDCVFSADEEDLTGLVVKWYFNKRPVPVYQWIPGNKPQDLGILKGRLDLSHTVSEVSWHQHRALAILNPTTELSGEYSCSVSSFFGEDYKSKNLVVYAPASEVMLTYRKPSLNSILVTCEANGLFPRPELYVYKSRPFLDRTHRNVISNSDLSKKFLQKGNSFNVTAKAVLFDFELRGETIFTCDISIPGTNYHIQRKLFYTPGQPQPQKSVLSGSEASRQPNVLLMYLLIGVVFPLRFL